MAGEVLDEEEEEEDEEASMPARSGRTGARAFLPPAPAPPALCTRETRATFVLRPPSTCVPFRFPSDV